MCHTAGSEAQICWFERPPVCMSIWLKRSPTILQETNQMYCTLQVSTLKRLPQQPVSIGLLPIGIPTARSSSIGQAGHAAAARFMAKGPQDGGTRFKHLPQKGVFQSPIDAKETAATLLGILGHDSHRASVLPDRLLHQVAHCPSMTQLWQHHGQDAAVHLQTSRRNEQSVLCGRTEAWQVQELTLRGTWNLSRALPQEGFQKRLYRCPLCF